VSSGTAIVISCRRRRYGLTFGSFNGAASKEYLACPGSLTNTVVAITMRQGDSASDQRHRLAKSSHEAVAALIATQTYCRIPFLPA
jgi:hypothetical protein